MLRSNRAVRSQKENYSLNSTPPGTVGRAFLSTPRVGRVFAVVRAQPICAACRTTADKRKPGLYWTLETDKGKISCKLYEAEAPVTVGTMVGLAIGENILCASGNKSRRCARNSS